MEKLNIAEILKDCPIGMELDSTIVDELYFGEVTEHMIKCYTKRYYESTCTYNTIYFHHDGTYLTTPNAKCVIFPKGKTTWEGFQRPFKDGDVIYNPNIKAIAILKSNDLEKSISHVFLNIVGQLYIYHNHSSDLSDWRFTTEEEKQKLFDAIKANSYKWNPETKTLEKLSMFKVGDRIRQKGKTSTYTITDINDAHYFCGKYVICDTCDNDWELVSNKFDITTLKPFESMVLVRDNDGGKWKAAFWGFIDSEKYYIVGGDFWNQCIPYKSNEHLLGTTNDCDEYYKTW